MERFHNNTWETFFGKSTHKAIFFQTTIHWAHCTTGVLYTFSKKIKKCLYISAVGDKNRNSGF